VIAAVRTAATAYAAAYNARDVRALAEQWTAGAELAEGVVSIKGREAIVASLADMRTAHPESSLAITVAGVQPLGTTAARVQGALAFTPRPGAEPRVSHFDSLRVLDGGTWRIAESRVVPTSRAALADLAWMVGAWRAADAATGGTVDATYERSLDGHALVGRITVTRKDGPKLEALDVITADRATGLVRSLLVDSAGARAEGTFATDGTTFNRTLEGTPADPALGDRVRWVQVLAPTGPDGLLVHAIDRTIDGRPAPDLAPLHFRRVAAAQPSR
jgi:ketosteroid isomerase-like protein